MSPGLELDYTWFDWEHGSAFDRAASAELSIFVNDRLVTEVEDVLARTVRSSVRVSAHALAMWFVANWWRLRWEPEGSSLEWRLSHNLGSVGGGFVWPDLEFASDGDWVSVQARQTDASGVEPIRYLSEFHETLPARQLESAVDRFVEALLTRLELLQTDAEDLRELWYELRAERGDPELSAWRRMEALLGFDPDEAPEGLVRELQTLGDELGAASVEEVAAVSRAAAPLHLRDLWSVGRAAAARARVPEADHLRALLMRLDDPSLQPWERATRIAAEARQVWGLADGPISNEALGDTFRVRASVLERAAEDARFPLPAGYRNGRDEQVEILLNRRYATGRRFALARIVADHLLAGEDDALLPITDARTVRQKFQRAFAQELLCPIDQLLVHLGEIEPSDEAIDDAAHHFDVSPLLVKTTLVNHGILAREVLP